MQSTRPLWGVERKGEKAEPFLSPTHPCPAPRGRKTTTTQALGAGALWTSSPLAGLQRPVAPLPSGEVSGV